MKGPLKQTAWFVYMLECTGGRIYTGVSPDVAARFAKHRAGRGGAFTRSFPPRRILATLRCASRGEALSTEHALKQLARPGKLRWAREHKYVMPASATLRRAGIRKAGSPLSRGRLRRPSAARGSRR